MVLWIIGCTDFTGLTTSLSTDSNPSSTTTAEKILVGISVDPTSLESMFELGSFKLSNLTLVLEYSDGSRQSLAFLEEWISQTDLVKLNSQGTHSIAVEYQGHSTTIEITLIDTLSTLNQIFQMGVASGDITDMTYEEWLESVRGEQGIPGENGREVSFRVTSSHIQWQYLGDSSWIDLVPLSTLVGEQGAPGLTPEFTVLNGELRWRYVGQTQWKILFALSTLQGKDGKDGLTPFIGENGNWWIRDEDTNIAAANTLNMDRIGTDGLYFDLTIRGGIAGYEVTGYSGTATDIVIPNEIFGEKVISIRAAALPTTITSLSISKYTNTIPSFQSYTNLVTFDFNNAPVTTIPANGFRGATKLGFLLNYQNITHIGSYGFYDTMILFTGFQFKNIVSIGSYAFFSNSNPYMGIESGLLFTEINDVITLSNQTFIYLPETITTIGISAFPAQFSVYYGGNSTVEYTGNFFFKNVKSTQDGYWYVDRTTYAGLLNYTGTLSEITVPNQLGGKNVNIVENYAFIGDNNLVRINLPNTITSIGSNAFILTRKLYILHIPASVVNISTSKFADWSNFGAGADEEGFAWFPAPVIVFENNQADMNFGSNTIVSFGWGRYAFGYTSNQLKHDLNFVYVEKLLSVEVLAFKNNTGKVTVPATYNSKPVTRINAFSFIGYNGGIVFVDISEGVEFISTNAFYGSEFLKYINVPLSMSAVNYRGFNSLEIANIYVKAASKPANWDSAWYYGVPEITWGTKLDAMVSDTNFVYEIVNGKAWIKSYLGQFTTSIPIAIPSSINGFEVIGIRANAIKHTSSTSGTYEIIIPSSVTTIEALGITFSRNLAIYSTGTSKPSGWNSQFAYSSYYGSYSESYKSYYWNGTWRIVNNNPEPIA
jgi:hypothetical protein